jgi:predicted esterase
VLLLLLPCAGAEIEISPGEKAISIIPFSKQETRWLKSASMTRYKEAEVSIAVPDGFDPARTYPILVTCVTGDRYLSNTEEMDKYWPQAIKEDWIVVTGWAQPSPKLDKKLYRRAVTVAALRGLAEAVPASADWPVAVAGFSGGSKNTALTAAHLQLEGYRIIGMMMAGCNEDLSGYALRKIVKDKAAYTDIPVFISIGESDRVSTVAQGKRVADSLRKRGFEKVRMETYAGGHVLNRDHVPVALQWFTSLDER